MKPGLANQQMNLLGHKHVSGNDKPILATGCLKLTLEEAVCRRAVQRRLPAITTEGNGMKVPGFLIPNKAPWHSRGILRRGHPLWGSCSPTLPQKARKDGASSLVGTERVGHPRFVLSHPSAKSAEGWGTRPWGTERVGHPPSGRVPSECCRYRPIRTEASTAAFITPQFCMN
jgi:hypothetical protein